MHWRLMASAKAKSQTYILANMTTYPSSQRKKRDHKKVLDLQINQTEISLQWTSILSELDQYLVLQQLLHQL